MKSILQFTIFLCCLCFFKPAFAQPQFIVQDNQGANVFPLGSTSSNRCQFVLTAAEFTGGTLYAGAISKIYILSGSAFASTTFTNFTVKLGMTTLTNTPGTVSTTPNMPWMTGLTTVVAPTTRTFTGLTNGGWIEILLDAPFTYDGVSNLIVDISQTAYTSGVTLKVNTGFAGNRRLWGSSAPTAIDGTSGVGRLNFGMDLITVIQGLNNAGTQAFTSPKGSYCSGSQPVKVAIKNFGSNSISSLKLQWQIGGVQQPDYIYPSTLASGAVDTVLLGNATLSNVTPTIIKAWTSLPNGVADVYNANDTIQASFKASDFFVEAVADSICIGDDAVLFLNPITGYIAGQLQWETSPNGTTWTGVPNSDNPNYVESNLQSNTYFRVKIGSGLNFCYSDSVRVNVIPIDTPTVVSNERCGPGTVTLSATGPGGNTLNWYEAAAGGVPIATTPTFTTPYLAATTNYWVSSAFGGTAQDSLAVPLAIGNTTGVYHHMFLVHSIAGMNIKDIGIKCSNPVNTLTDWEVYYRPDNYQTIPGANTSATGWILLGSSTGVASLGVNAYTTIASGFSLNIPANATYSIYIAPVGGATHQYYSPAMNTVTASDLYGEIRAGNRGSSLFNVTSSGGQAVVKLGYSTGCESARKMVTAHIRPQPAVDLGSDFNVCVDAGANFTLDAGTFPNTPTYLWDNNSTSQTRGINISGNYSVAVTNSFGCVGRDTVNVTLRDNPVVDLGNDTTVCEGIVLTLDAGSDGISYFWNTGEISNQINVDQTGRYTVIVTNSIGCTKTDTIYVTMSGHIPTIDGISINNTGPRTFKFNVVNPQNAVSYDWDFGDGSAHSPMINPTHTFPSPNNYLVKLKIVGTCGQLVDSSYVHIVGIGDVGADKAELFVYPNPSSGMAKIINKGNLRMEQIEVFNVLGQKIYSKKSDGPKEHEMSLSGIASGIYTVQILTDEGTFTQKLEIVR